jgi:hypothetical protein
LAAFTEINRRLDKGWRFVFVFVNQCGYEPNQLSSLDL